MRMPRLTTCAVAAWFVLGTALSAQHRPDRMMADELFDAYREQGPRVVSDAIASMSMGTRFERFRADFEARVFPGWQRGPQTPPQAMFMLEVAVATDGRRHSYPGWEKFVTLGAVLLSDRTEPPGANVTADAFEVLWHQTAVAFLDGLQNPFQRDRAGVQTMTGRIAAVAAPAGAPPLLVEPWVELARGVSLELMSIDRPEGLDVLGPEALKHYRQAVAAGSGDTRAEATLRSARLLTRLRRPAEALAMLIQFDDTWTSDATYRYWQPLLLGQALEALGRSDDAVLSYRRALRVVPSAEAPRVAVMALEAKRQRSTEAAAQLMAIEATRDSVVDPWRSYRDGDARFFQARLDALREMSRR